ncbi:GFA family protein [Bradyrhizobium sp. th.b2]|uniref:GFA family protein n=1 Tax=Bradyrhizobium sp. th-b2 TaxID=172088 RepID=UPI0035292687
MCRNRLSATVSPLCLRFNCTSGAAFSLSMLTLRKDFEKRSGETIACGVPGGSGAMHRQHVCPSCLTRTHTELLAHPEVINVRPGTLDTPAVVAPIAQIWTSLALPWALLPNIPNYEENPPDVPALMGLWRETHSANLCERHVSRNIAWRKLLISAPKREVRLGSNSEVGTRR